MIALLVALSAQAQVFDALPDSLSQEPSAEADPVVNGEPVRGDDWADTVGIVLYGSYVGCTGTLIHPKLVLTAGHCVGSITDVVIGSNDWTREGDVYRVEQTIEYPRSQSSYDAAVLVLEERVKDYDHRVIAQECILEDYLFDGAEVAVVGFGGTRSDGGGYNSKKNEGYTFVQDADGDASRVDGMYTGFNESVSPGGELGAGGNNVDSCFGDSGGPLYLLTDEGDYLVGITSRAYIGVPWNEPCLYGGVYVRPDALIEWIEEETGKALDAASCNAAPTADVTPILVTSGGQASTSVTVDDPDGNNDKATIVVAVDPEVGTVEITSSGEVLYTAPADYAGTDNFVIAVTDKGAAAKYPRGGQPISIEVEVPVTVTAAPSAGTTPGTVPMTESSGGCACSGSGSAATWWALLPMLLVARRRR
jgi:secreted trypsin-like serine protease